MKFLQSENKKVRKAKAKPLSGKHAKSNSSAAVTQASSGTPKQSSNRYASEGDDLSLKRKYDIISDEDRLKLILLINDFGMSCHKASKVLNIAYNNAKVIYRIYKNE